MSTGNIKGLVTEGLIPNVITITTAMMSDYRSVNYTITDSIIAVTLKL